MKEITTPEQGKKLMRKESVHNETADFFWKYNQKTEEYTGPFYITEKQKPGDSDVLAWSLENLAELVVDSKHGYQIQHTSGYNKVNYIYSYGDRILMNFQDKSLVNAVFKMVDYLKR